MKTIQTPTHLLLVDETAEIKEGDFFVCWETVDGIPSNYEVLEATQSNMHPFIQDSENYKKVIAASPKLGDLPEFETLPPNICWDCKGNISEEGICFCNRDTEDDVEKLADDYVRNETDKTIQLISKYSYKDGYKQAKSETMFSEEDLMLAFYEGRGKSAGSSHMRTFKYHSFEDYIQSLTKPKEYEFVVEMEELAKATGKAVDHDGFDKEHIKYQPKIINNKIQGKWQKK